MKEWLKLIKLYLLLIIIEHGFVERAILEIYKDTECDVKVIHSSWAGKEVHTINNIKKEVNDIYKVHADG